MRAFRTLISGRVDVFRIFAFLLFIFAGGVIDMGSVAGSISPSVTNSVLSLEAVLFGSLLEILELLELSNDTAPSNCSMSETLFTFIQGSQLFFIFTFGIFIPVHGSSFPTH